MNASATEVAFSFPGKTLVVAGATAELLALMVKVKPDVEMAGILEIDSADMLTEAEDTASRIKHAMDSIEAERVATVKPLNDTVKEVNADFKGPYAQLESVLGGLKAKMTAYKLEQQRLAAEAAAEAQRKREEAAREAAAREAKARADADQLAAQAKEAQAQGSEIVANALMQQAATAVDAARTDAQQAVLELHSAAPVVPASITKGLRGTWSAEVTDMAALLVHAGEQIKAGDLSLLSLFEVKKSSLNTLAKLQGEHLRLPGVKPTFNPTVAVSGKKGAAALSA